MQGMLFKPWKQKAIRESPLDRLWQTRRLDHLKEINKSPDKWTFTKHGTDFKGNMEFEFRRMDTHGILLDPWFIKPRYRIGETVYIKEAYWEDSGDIYYKSDTQEGQIPTNMHFTEPIGKAKWKSPMFMPEWAARDFIKIADVRPERLNEIENHPEDYKAEDYQPIILDNSAVDGKPFEASMDFAWFENLWDTINPKYPYRTNPFVWRICFNLIEGKR